jgi:hypothetical protein
MAYILGSVGRKVLEPIASVDACRGSLNADSDG